MAHWLAPSALAALLAAPRLPLLAIAHSGDIHTLARARALAPAAALLARPGVRLSFVTEDLRARLLAAAPRPLRARLRAASQVCPMGIDVARLAAARASAPRTAGPTVLFLGRLVPVKGASVLAAAARLWRSDARLVLAGAGPDEPALRRLAAAAPPGRVELAGEVRGAARDRLLAQSDVVALPSIRVEGGRTEGMPLVALEAMAAGAAVVASAVGGLAELPAAAITRVPPGDPAALAAAIDRLLLDPDARAAQVRAAKEHALAVDWSRIGPRLRPSEGPYRTA
ncbi:MAG TPA: glycosyltransferase [Kofleriaceae bacterium]|nr:glycosyltransferase [Kofleriaceae bacterium]